MPILIWCTFSVAHAQKTIDKDIDARGISSIHIESDEIFRISVTTAKIDKIHIKSGIAGETFESMLVKTEIKEGTVLITTGRSPYYRDVDDKLAAHKVMSVELTIEIPQQEELWINSSLASVLVNGSCSYINFNLSSGDCRLVSFRGSGTINTKEGNITVENPVCSIDAESRNGRVAIAKGIKGDCKLILRSIDGDIAAAPSK